MISDKLNQFAVNVERWKETADLSFELADVMHSLLQNIIGYCESNNVPIHKNEAMYSLVTKAQVIFGEIETVNSLKFPKLLADEKKHLNGTDEEVPAPRKPK